MVNENNNALHCECLFTLNFIVLHGPWLLYVLVGTIKHMVQWGRVWAFFTINPKDNRGQYWTSCISDQTKILQNCTKWNGKFSIYLNSINPPVSQPTSPQTVGFALIFFLLFSRCVTASVALIFARSGVRSCGYAGQSSDSISKRQINWTVILDQSEITSLEWP